MEFLTAQVTTWQGLLVLVMGLLAALLLMLTGLVPFLGLELRKALRRYFSDRAFAATIRATREKVRDEVAALSGEADSQRDSTGKLTPQAQAELQGKALERILATLGPEGLEQLNAATGTRNTNEYLRGLIDAESARWRRDPAVPATIVPLLGLLGLLFVPVLQGCPGLPPVDGCTPRDQRCHQGAPQVCSPSQRWTPAAEVCHGGAVCCETSSVYGGRAIHACVPANACLPIDGGTP